MTPRANHTRDSLSLELWVFWFEDRHTGIIDANQYLAELEETKMGSFTWDKIISSKGGTASPSPNGKANQQQQPRAKALVSLPEEYKLFVKSVRNLVNRAMLSKGAIPLGDFFISQHNDNDSRLFQGPLPVSTTSTMVACAYNTYVTGTDLVFRPYTRQLRIRALVNEDLDNYGLKVILSPSGEQACLTSCASEISEQVQDETMREWSSLYNIPIQHLTSPYISQSTQTLPSLVAIRTKTNATALYPAKLVFVPTSTRQSSARMAGMDGVFSCDRGLTRDIGKDWSRWSWINEMNQSNNIHQDGCRINYWSLDDSAGKMMDALAAGYPTQEYAMLRKALDQQPVPAIRSKAASRRSSAQDTTAMTTPIEGAQNDSLLDFIMRNFNNPTDEEDTPMTMESAVEDSTASAPYTVTPTDQHPDETPVLSQDITSTDDTFGFGYSNNMFATERWDNDMDDTFDNFDFDVTEADFDFFKSEKKPPPPAACAMMDLDKPEPVDHSMDVSTSVPTTTTDNFVPETIKEEPLDISILERPVVPMATQEVIHQPQQAQSATSGTLNSPMACDTTPVASSDAGISTTAPGTVDMSICTTPDIRQHAYQQSIPHVVTTSKSGYAMDNMHMIPKDFSAVTFPIGVDDAKYMDGGKFDYKSPSNDMGTGTNETAHQDIKLNRYRPDYVPPKILVDEAKRDEDKDNAMDGKNEDDDNASESGSTSTTISSSDESDQSDASSSGVSLSSQGDEQNGDVLERIQNAQMTYIRRLLGDIKNRPKRHRVGNLLMDYDSPFPTSVMDTIQPEKMSPDDIASLDQLCQQAVWGGYPFAGELPESMSGCSDGVNAREDATTIVTRQTTLIQSIRGDITHVSSLPSTGVRVIQGFKCLLEEIFSQQTSEMTTSADVPDAMDSPSTTTSTIVGGVNVKGPLKVQEYYQLLETTPTQSRYYGKFQVKKRRSNEPDLQLLGPPDIVVGRNDDWLEGSAGMIHLWEKLKLEPYSFKNNVRYFAMYPDNQEMTKAVSTFIANLSGAYEVCNLGTHLPGRAEPYTGGIATVPLHANTPWTTAYNDACERLGTTLGMTNMLPQERNTTNIVIYLINPSTQLSSNLALSRAFRTLVSAYTAVYRRFGRATIHPRALAMQIIPAEHVLRVGESCAMPVFKDIAFSVYSQCHSTLQRSKKVDNTQSHSILYTPPWVIAQRVPDTIRFSFKRPLVPYPTVIVDSDAMLHMVYSFSLDRRWMIIVWSDHRGELVEFAVLEIQAAVSPGKPNGSPLVQVFTEAWSRTKKLAHRTGFSWQYAIAKMGLIFESELQAWEDVLHSAGDHDEKVAIICIDIDSPLTIDIFLSNTNSSLSAEELTAQAMSQISERYTYSSASPTPTDSPRSKENKPKSQPIMDPSTLLILLNHRMAYSRQRVNIYQGDLSMESVNELDRWMLPLSSGYLVKQNETQEVAASCKQPSILELHLVYNKQSQNARTTLREIMKQYNALSYVNHPPSYAGMHASMLPNHLVLVERLTRILLVVGS
ncbi:hypothetical protein K492DRAFT_210351 [Lichtheimia hyalospora FSU 10163]|nr:hypothetical protein K492DRAFT_210351 [Lichtheimia hyalospora FSU 10163]